MIQKPQTPNATSPPSGTLGTFAGVFTPSILTILGIILFLRLGYVVGNAGLGRALIIICMANGISIMTSLSLSAIATNLKVKGGGDYYLISRTLGMPFGGAIGVVLFLAQSVSIAFYCIGFGEALGAVLPGDYALPARWSAAIAVAFLFVLAWLGADWATKFQYIVMFLLVAALASFFWGGLPNWHVSMALANIKAPSGGGSFWILFALFFPAVTGFTQGVSMSGDLADPGRSIPLGTFSAVGVSILVYLGAAVLFAGVMPNAGLSDDYQAMRRVARWSLLVDAGVVAATLSSAMASFLGAPRILQSLSSDRIFPFLLFFAKGSDKTGNPRRGVLLCAAIAWLTVGLGNLNLVAPIVSMFFLISYGLLNYATFFEARAASPSFRPRFRFFDHRLSFLGAVACLVAMLAVDPVTGLMSICIIFAIYQYLERTAGPTRWADSRRSFYLYRARESLIAAAREPYHDRDWRPLILAFSNDDDRRGRLLRFASWLEGGSGLTTAVKVLEGEGLQMLKQQKEAEADLRKDIAALGVSAFALVVYTPHAEVAVQTLIQAFGIGPIKANTILINGINPEGQKSSAERMMRYTHNLLAAFRLGANIIILQATREQWDRMLQPSSEPPVIDVWWWGDSTSHLMLLLAYLCTRSDAWESASIRVYLKRFSPGSEATLEAFKQQLREMRISARAVMAVDATERDVLTYSSESDLVFMPFRFRRHQIITPFGGPADRLISGNAVTALVMAAEDIDLDAEPEQGTAGQTAEALDALADAEKKQRAQREAALQAAIEANESKKALDDAMLEGASLETRSELQNALEQSQKHAETAAQEAAKARSALKKAAEEVEALVGKSSPTESEPDD